MNIETIANTVQNFMSEFSKKFNHKEKWYNVDNKELGNGAVIDHAAEEIIRELVRTAKKYNAGKLVDKTFSEDAGFVTSVHTVFGSRHERILFRFSLGADSKRLSNSILVEDIPSTARLYDYETLKQIFVFMVRYFNPDWGTVSSISLFSDLAQQTINEYYVGWINYFKRELNVPPLENKIGILSQVIEEAGKLYSITTDRFDVSNPAHVEKALMLANFLKSRKISL